MPQLLNGFQSGSSPCQIDSLRKYALGTVKRPKSRKTMDLPAKIRPGKKAAISPVKIRGSANARQVGLLEDSQWDCVCTADRER